MSERPRKSFFEALASGALDKDIGPLQANHILISTLKRISERQTEITKEMRTIEPLAQAAYRELQILMQRKVKEALTLKDPHEVQKTISWLHQYQDAVKEVERMHLARGDELNAEGQKLFERTLRLAKWGRT